MADPLRREWPQMYADFFGLRELPFNNTPDPRFFFSTPDHEEALASLVYAVNERKGFVLLTGEAGAGKTLVSRLMLRHFGTRIASAGINHAVTDPADLLESVLSEFELPYPQNAGNTLMVRVLHDFLLAQFAQNTPIVLILDEAQGLSMEVFEVIRMIGNLEADDAKLLQIVILGQPELRARFQSNQMLQLRQRIFRSFHLPRLSRELTEGYICHRLSIVGADYLEIFDNGAINRIHEKSQGLPRIINTICDNALLSAYSADTRKIDAPFVDSVIEQMMTIGDAASGVAREPTWEQASVPPAAVPQYPQPVAPAPGVAYVPCHAENWALALKVAKIETRLDEDASKADLRQNLAKIRDESLDRSHQTAETVQTIQRQFQQEVSGVVARMETLEGKVDGLGHETAKVSDLRNEVHALVEEGRSLLQRTEIASEGLEKRERRVSNLLGITKTVLKETHTVLDRLNSSSAEARSTEKRTRGIREQVARQAERTGRLTTMLAKTLDGIEKRAASFSKTVALRKQASKTVGEVLLAAPSISRRAHSMERFMGLLDSSRESLCDLRGLIKSTAEVRGHGSESTAEAFEDSPPEDLLARQVHSLAGLVESAGPTSL